VFERLCRAAEWLKLQRIIWVVVLVFALVGFSLTTAAMAVRILDGIDHPSVKYLVDTIKTHLAFDEDVAGLIRTVSMTMIGLSVPYIFIVCQQRKAVLNALAAGYWKSYLSRFVGTDYKFIVIPPAHLITVETDSAIKQSSKLLSGRANIELKNEFIDEASRSALVVYKDGERLPILVDMCRNLTILGDLVENELGKFLGGTFCTAETKFRYLSEQYFKHLNSVWIRPMDILGTIVILKDLDDPIFEETINESLRALRSAGD